jgi:hypothetical protein
LPRYVPATRSFQHRKAASYIVLGHGLSHGLRCLSCWPILGLIRQIRSGHRMDDAPYSSAQRPSSKLKAPLASSRMKGCVDFLEPVNRFAEQRPGAVWRLTEPIEHGAAGRTAVPAVLAADNALLVESCTRRF